MLSPPGVVVLCEAPLQEEKWELWWQCKPWCKFICLSSHSSLYLELILSIRSTSLLLDKHKWNGKGIDIKRWTSNWKWSFGEKENFRISKVQGNKERDRVPTHYLHVYSSDRVRILFKFTHSHSDRGKSKHYQTIDIWYKYKPFTCRISLWWISEDLPIRMWRSTSFRRKIRSLRQKFTGGLLTRYFRKRSNSRLFLILFCQNHNFLTSRFLTARYWRRQWCLLCLTSTDLPGMMRLARWGEGGSNVQCLYKFRKGVDVWSIIACGWI